jgi:hypothetical protein
MKKLTVVLGALLMGLSTTSYAAGWFALPRPTVPDVIVTHIDAATVGEPAQGVSLSLKLDLQVVSQEPTPVTLTVTTACTVNGAEKVEKIGLDGDFSDLQIGTTKHVEVSPFATNQLGGLPGRCNITLHENTDIGVQGDTAHFCYTDGHVWGGVCT